MKISKKSWHYWLLDNLWEVPNNLCSYILKLFLSIAVIFTFFIILNIATLLLLFSISSVIGYWIAGILNGWHFVTLINNTSIFSWDSMTSAGIIIFMLSIILLACYIVAKGITYLGNYLINGNKNNIISQWIKDKKEKTCSIIEFTED